MQPQTEKQDSVINNLRSQLRDKEEAIEVSEPLTNPFKQNQPGGFLTFTQFNKCPFLRRQKKDKWMLFFQAAIEDKFKALEEKDTEVRQLKTALRERDRDIERANQMLLTTEETIDVS